MRGLALQVQEGLGRDPFVGDVYVFRGRRGSLIKAIGMTALVYHFMPSAWTAANSSGRKRWTALFR